MADEKGIDPRYAPQFQRGYDPARHPPASALSGSAAAPSRPGPAVVPAPGPGPAISAGPEAPRPVGERESVEKREKDEEQVEEPENVEEHEDGEERRRLDPAWLLPALSVALLALAGVLFWHAATDLTEYYAQTYAESVIRTSLPGPLLIASVLAFTGWIVVLVVREARRR